MVERPNFQQNIVIMQFSSNFRWCPANWPLWYSIPSGRFIRLVSRSTLMTLIKGQGPLWFCVTIAQECPGKKRNTSINQSLETLSYKSIPSNECMDFAPWINITADPIYTSERNPFDLIHRRFRGRCSPTQISLRLAERQIHAVIPHLPKTPKRRRRFGWIRWVIIASCFETFTQIHRGVGIVRWDRRNVRNSCPCCWWNFLCKHFLPEIFAFSVTLRITFSWHCWRLLTKIMGSTEKNRINQSINQSIC